MNNLPNLEKWCEDYKANGGVKVAPQSAPLHSIVDSMLGDLARLNSTLDAMMGAIEIINQEIESMNEPEVKPEVKTKRESKK